MVSNWPSDYAYLNRYIPRARRRGMDADALFNSVAQQLANAGYPWITDPEVKPGEPERLQSLIHQHLAEQD